jgi:hypothetical protein
MRAAAAIALAAFLGACAFWSDGALFDESDAVAPIADGARFLWVEDDAGETQTIVYRRVGAGYEFVAVNSDETPMGVIFVEVRETPEEDYIAQVTLRPEDKSRAYAFMWRTDRGYRIVSAPRVLEDDERGAAALAQRCSARPNGECRFSGASDVVALYREAVYPAFVLTGDDPNDYIDQTPVAEAMEDK